MSSGKRPFPRRAPCVTRGKRPCLRSHVYAASSCCRRFRMQVASPSVPFSIFKGLVYGKANSAFTCLRPKRWKSVSASLRRDRCFPTYSSENQIRAGITVSTPHCEDLGRAKLHEGKLFINSSAGHCTPDSIAGCRGSRGGLPCSNRQTSIWPKSENAFRERRSPAVAISSKRLRSSTAGVGSRV